MKFSATCKTYFESVNLIPSNILSWLFGFENIGYETDKVALFAFQTRLKDNSKVNQILLIEDYLKSFGLTDEWKSFKNIFNQNETDIIQFFKDFFITKFNFKEFNITRLYENFINYFETMLQYISEDVIMTKLKRTAKLYNDILNVNFANEKLRMALIQIKMHKGEDTYAYLLNIYEDFMDGNITEVTFLEILSTIDEYLKNRLKTPNDVGFNELIKYLNAFITCK